jgi:hypothetical protein
MITASQIYKEKLGDPAKSDSLIQSLRQSMTAPLDGLSTK